MTQSFGQNWQSVNDAALGPIGSAAREANSSIMARLSLHVDSPLRMYAAATPDAKLYFSANRTMAGDGSSKATPAQDDLILSFPASSLDFQTGATSGGTFNRDGVAFTRPSSTTGQYRRCVFVYRADNVIDCSFSAEVASYGSLADPGSLFALIEGIPLGWIDLIGTTTNATGAWKTASSAGSSATSIIENAVSGASAIFRIASGGGAGGAIKDFKIGSVADPYAIIKGGYLKIDDGRELATYDGANYGKDITINLDTALAGGGPEPADATAYYLYVDLDALGAQVTVGARKLYAVQQAQFVVLTTTPEQTNPRRYVPVGYIKSATTGNAWSGAGSSFGTMAIRHHETLARFFAYPETFVDESITSIPGSPPYYYDLNHNLSGEPHAIYLTYDDGTTEIGLDLSAHLLNVTPTQIRVSPLGLIFGAGQKIRVRAVRFPQQPALASLSRSFTSGWFTAAGSPSTAHLVPHGLNDADDIKGYAVEEWNTDNNTYRMIDPSGLVVKFDATNFTLNWTGISFTAPNRKYRVIAGGSPLPYAIPIEYGGFTKFVGIGSGSYSTLTAALAAAAPGDSIFVNRDTTEPAGDLTIGVADVKVTCKPGVKIGMSGAMTNGLRLTAARIAFDGRVSLVPSGAQARGISVEAADCKVIGKLELDAAQTLTDALHVTSGGTRTYAQVGVSKTAGTITNLETNNDGAGKTDVWGG